MNDAILRFRRKRSPYRATFLTPEGAPHRAGQLVLADLRRFCRATSTTASIAQGSGAIDPIAMAMAEGRREVWNHLMQYLHLDDRVIQNLQEGLMPDNGDE